MGRKHRISRDPRLREEGDWWPTRVPDALPGRIAPYVIRADRPIVGIDVGENFLDLGQINPGAKEMRFERLALAGQGDSPIGHIADEIGRLAPELRYGGIALIDSPRAPRVANGERFIDQALRCLIAKTNRRRQPEERIRFSLFPTPMIDYFLGCARDPKCKPHLARIARQLADSGSDSGTGFSLSCRHPRAAPPNGGALFTRFMLAGFATHRACDALEVEAFEAYPYLAFSLWKRPVEPLPAKSARRAALKTRQNIIDRLCRAAAISAPQLTTLDQADAAVLALTARLSLGGLVIEAPIEGRFLLAASSRRLV